MVEQTDAHTNRLIRLLMMLPSPESPQYQGFWDKVADEHSVSRSYIESNIARPLQQILLAPEKDQSVPRENLAKYTLFFFGKPSGDLIAAINSQVGLDTPGEVAGRLWIQQMCAAAFEVLVDNPSEDQIRAACASWMRSVKIHAL